MPSKKNESKQVVTRQSITVASPSSGRVYFCSDAKYLEDIPQGDRNKVGDFLNPGEVMAILVEKDGHTTRIVATIDCAITNIFVDHGQAVRPGKNIMTVQLKPNTLN